ncbi:protein regulator of cytokinesis family protein [Enterobacter cloacae]|uniref:protein regulator of cytokinesis family protein n=1 Tax=Enterobacter cloacae TaxID=550 RepID=UPI002074ADD7|nr:protein regulator of cytokinesis family protein [Enterobacter cloacae]MCM7496504.1 protein regulator of cytokinesis family protein [Enterobacter cloacae]
MSKSELLQKIQVLASECHELACELDIGDERTEMFEIYGVLRNLGRRGYASQVGRRMNPLLASCDEDDDEDDD